MSNPKCDRTGCSAPAAGALGFNIYPPKAVMKHHKTDKPLSRLLTGLHVCQAHAKEADPVEMLGARIWPLVKTIERSSGVQVDMAATKAVVVPFTDPEWLRMVAERSGA